jgi:hypothetical protein
MIASGDGGRIRHDRRKARLEDARQSSQLSGKILGQVVRSLSYPEFQTLLLRNGNLSDPVILDPGKRKERYQG